MDNLYHWSDLHQKQGDKMRLRNMFKKFYKCAEIDIFDSNISDYSGRDTCTSWWYCGFGFTPYPFFFILTPKQCQADLGTGVQLLTLSNTLAPPSGNGNRKKIPRLHRNHFYFMRIRRMQLYIQMTKKTSPNTSVLTEIHCKKTKKRRV